LVSWAQARIILIGNKLKKLSECHLNLWINLVISKIMQTH
jgi:hypothetical protein